MDEAFISTIEALDQKTVARSAQLEKIMDDLNSKIDKTCTALDSSKVYCVIIAVLALIVIALVAAYYKKLNPPPSHDPHAPPGCAH